MSINKIHCIMAYFHPQFLTGFHLISDVKLKLVRYVWIRCGIRDRVGLKLKTNSNSSEYRLSVNYIVIRATHETKYRVVTRSTNQNCNSLCMFLI